MIKNNPQTDQGTSKSIVTLALPMYTVGIGIFFIYTCCKVGAEGILRIDFYVCEFSIGQERTPMNVKSKRNVV